MILAIAISLDFTAFAGDWQKDSVGWWYQEDDTSYPTNQWKEIKGTWYYFDEAGYLVTNTFTSDGYLVDGDGAWIQNEKEYVYSVVSRYLTQNGTPGYWLLYESENPEVVEIWEHWPTGSKGKIVVDLKTGDCIEKAPYWGIDLPYDDIPVQHTFLFNLYQFQ